MATPTTRLAEEILGDPELPIIAHQLARRHLDFYERVVRAEVAREGSIRSKLTARILLLEEIMDELLDFESVRQSPPGQRAQRALG